MGIPGERKLSTEHRKIILREIAEELGLPKEIAWRPKQAAQYGSGFDKVMEKTSQKNRDEQGRICCTFSAISI